MCLVLSFLTVCLETYLSALEIYENIEQGFWSDNAQVTGVDFENGAARIVLLADLPDEYREGVKFVLTLQALGLMSGKLTRSILWQLFSGEMEVPDLFGLVIQNMDIMPDIDGFLEMFNTARQAASSAFEREPDAKPPEGSLRELTDEEIIVFADGGYPTQKVDSPSTHDWENTLATISVSLAAENVMENPALKREAKGLVLSYGRTIGDISTRYRAQMNLLYHITYLGEEYEDVYKEAYLALCVNGGVSKYTIENAPPDGVLQVLIDGVHEHISCQAPSVENAMLDVSRIVDKALSGVLGTDVQEQSQRLIYQSSSELRDRINGGDILNFEQGLALGLTINSTELLRIHTEKSLITIAGPGSGKTQCHVLPNLNSFNGAAIVLDIKGECFRHSYKWRKENVGPIIPFAPTTGSKSARYNPLSFISQDENQVWEDSRLLAELLIVPKNQHDPTWETQGRQLLTMIIAYVVYLPDERRNMASVLDLLNGIGFEDALEILTKEVSPFPSAMRRTAHNFKRMKADAEKQFQGVVSGALQHLAIWEGPVVERLTSTSDWSPLDFRKSPAPTLFLIIKPNEIETYAPLLRVIIAQHVRMLMQEEPDRTAPPVLFMLDELPRLGRMEPIREALEVGRSYRLQLWMFAQFVGQLSDAYGKEIAEGMIESCGVRMYMNPGQETAEKLSKALGTRENMLTGKTEPVVTPQALTGPDWKDDILVFATGEKPLRLKKAFFHEMREQPDEPEPTRNLTEQDITERELAARNRL